MDESRVMVLILAVWRMNWTTLQSLLVDYASGTSTMTVTATFLALFHSGKGVAPITKKWIIAGATTTTTMPSATEPKRQDDYVRRVGGSKQFIKGKPLNVIVLTGRSKMILFYISQPLMKKNYHVGILSINVILESWQDDQNS